MIELVSVEVENFRSFASATFTPLGIGQGMTAINGANGTGKSSLATHAIMWALYGVTPDGVPVKAMRRQGSTGEVSATVTFRHQGQSITVSRMLKGKNDTTIARILVDEVEQTNVSARTAASWVARRLGVDAEGFSTAFVVKQKEVDALVRARPAERRALIERLAGIHHMSTALAKAREAFRRVQNTLEVVGEAPEVDGLERALLEAQGRLQEMQEVLSASENDSQKSERLYKEARLQAEKVGDQESRLNSLNAEARLIADRISTAKEEYERLSGIVGASILLPDAQSALSRAEEEVKRLEDVIRAAKPLVDEATRLQTEAEELEAAVIREERDTNDLRQKCMALQEELRIEEVEGSGLPEIEHSLGLVVEKIGALSSEISRFDSAISLLETSGEHNASCPTCRGPLAEPDALVEQMKAERLESIREHELAAKERVRLEEQVVTARKKDSNRASKTAALESNVAALASAEKRLEQIKGRLGAAEERAESAAEHAHGALVSQQMAQDALPLAREEEQNARRLLQKAEAAIEAEERLATLTNTLDDYHAELEAVNAERRQLQVDLEVMNVVLARALAEKAHGVLLLAQRAVSDAETAVALAERDVSDSEKMLHEAVNKRQLFEETTRELEQSQALVEALDEFRRDRIARLAPELAEVASDLLSTMTDGRYSSLDLDEDFTPIVTESETGIERPTSWLSGGEESSVALALRIAIGEVVAGQRGGLLVLDEVLTAQDQLRRNATMTAIRTLPRQVITINHVSEATDLVDLVANVIAEGASGSRVEQTAVESEPIDPRALEELAS